MLADRLPDANPKPGRLNRVLVRTEGRGADPEGSAPFVPQRRIARNTTRVVEWPLNELPRPPPRARPQKAPTATARFRTSTAIARGSLVGVSKLNVL